MRCVRIVLCLAAVLCGLDFRAAGAAEVANYSTRLWQMEDGLPHNIVQALAQTRDGYLWVGTREGLARFDGFGFLPVDLQARETPLSILSLLVDRAGSLWVGTESAGLFRWFNGQWQQWSAPDGTNRFSVFEIHQGAGETLWLATSVGILRWTGTRLEWFAEFRNLVESLCVDQAGDLWKVGRGLQRLTGKEGAGEVWLTEALPSRARRMYCDRDGTFWIGAEDSLVRWKNGQATRYRKGDGPEGFIGVITRDHAGEMWIGSYVGLTRFVEGQFVRQGERDEPSYRVFAIFEDQEQNLWVGSEEGLRRITPQPFRTLTKKDGLALNTVVSVCASRDGSVWISAWGGGLHHWVDGKITVLGKTNGLSSDFIMAMHEARDGSLWVGTDYGSTLNHIKDGQITWYGPEQGFFEGVTTALYEDVAGDLWIGSRDTLQRMRAGKFTIYTAKDGLSHNMINALCAAPRGSMWVGTAAGLTRWDGERFENLALRNQALQANVLSLYPDMENTLWIGTKGHGLLRWHEGRVQSVTTANGLFSDAIYSILEDGRGNLWLNSSRGIFRVEKREVEAVMRGEADSVNSITYGKADGILSSGQYKDVTQPAACRSRDGRLWFRTTQGVVVVDPEEITTNRRPPPVAIGEIVADKRVIAFAGAGATDGHFVIPPGRGELEIHYAALSYRAPEKNRFRYRLEGLDLDWVEAGPRRMALYNNLRPGSYRFLVVAANNDGVWNEAGTQVSFRLLPHFWETWWFVSLVVLGSFATVGGAARFVTRRRMQRKLETLKQQNAVERERARIARDMHDELGAKLTRISFQGAVAKRQLADPEGAGAQIEKMSETARELVLSLDQIVWAVDPENDSLENLANYICRYAGEFVEHTPLHCEFVIPTTLPAHRLSTEVRHNVFLAVKEALNNALKHSGGTRITLTIAVRAEEFEVTIADDGRGLPAEESGEAVKGKRTGRGLVNLRERLEAIAGRFEVASEPQRGTRIRLIVPLNGRRAAVSSIYPTRGGRA